MTLSEQVQKDMTDAMKARDEQVRHLVDPERSQQRFGAIETRRVHRRDVVHRDDQLMRARSHGRSPVRSVS